VKTPEESITQALYFRALHSHLLQKPDLKENYELLLDQYNRYPESFRSLTKNDILRIKRIQDDVLNNRYSLFSGPLEIGPAPEFEQEKSVINHRQICDSFMGRQSELEVFTGPINHMAREYSTIFGPVDIMVRSGDTVHIVEVKTLKTDHSIVGQVMKYYIGVSLWLMTRQFDDVKIITICPGYDKPSYLGLKQIGARTLIFNSKTLEIKELQEC
jgi:hypothetical protein